MESVAGISGLRFGKSLKDFKGDVVLRTQDAPAEAEAPSKKAAPPPRSTPPQAATTPAQPPAATAPTAPAAATTATTASAATTTAAPSNNKKWTFLFYINGNNFLSKQAPSLLRMLEFAGSDKNINVAAQVARKKGTLDMITRDWSGVRRYEVPETEKKLEQGEIVKEIFRTLFPPYTRGIESKMVSDLGEADMGHKRTFTDFLKWGMKEYPADNVCVVMLGPSQGMKGMMHDETSDNFMTPAELKEAMADAEKVTGKKVDVLAFDASNATQAEMLYELKDSVKYVVGSEGLVSGSGMSVPSVVYELKKSNIDRARTPEEVAQTFTMVGSMAVTAQGFTPTISAIDMAKVGGVADALNQLGDALLKSGISKDKIREIMHNTQEVGMPGVTKAYEGVRDASHFAKLLYKDTEITDPAVKQAAINVMQSVEDSLVGEAHRGGFYRNASGISVFMPDNYGFIRPDHYPYEKGFDHKFDYEKMGFAQGSKWPEFLASVSEDSFSGKLTSKLLGEGGADTLAGITGQLAPTVKSYSGWASTIGWWESFNSMQSGRPGRFLFLPPTAAAYAGAYGGLYDMYNGVTKAVSDFKVTGSYDAVIYNGLDVVGGFAKAAACISLVQPQLVPFAYAAGVFGFAKPWIKNAYEYFMQYKGIRDSIALNEGAESKAAVLAAQQMIGKRELWDK